MHGVGVLSFHHVMVLSCYNDIILSYYGVIMLRCCHVIVLSWHHYIIPSGPRRLTSYAKEPSCASLAFALNDPQVSSSSVARDRRRQLTRV